MTDVEISKRFGTSDVLISQQRKRWGIKTISFTQRSARASGSLSLDSLTKDTLSDLYTRNSDDQIAKLYSVSKVAIRKLRHKFGIETIFKTTRALTGCYKRS